MGEQNKLYLGLNEQYFKHRPSQERETAKGDLNIAFNEGWAEGGKFPEPDGSYLLESEEDYICCRTTLSYQMRNEHPIDYTSVKSSPAQESSTPEDPYEKWWNRAH